MERIWVYGELASGEITRSTLELVSAARTFSDQVEVFLLSSAADQYAAVLGAHGAKLIYALKDAGESMAGPLIAGAMAPLAEEQAPDAILFSSSYDARDGAARLSVRLDRPVLANVVGLQDLDGKLVSEHALFGATLLAKASFTGAGPQIFLVRPKTFAAEPNEAPPAEVREVTSLPTQGSGRARVVKREVAERQGPDLDGASVVVTGGRGMGGQENFALIEALAALLGGAPAGTRAVVDAGWVPYSYQVGQTGKTVKPELYLACGVSGATQHLVGMKSSAHIIAINKDESAPMMAMADLAVVGDVLAVVPRLIAALEQRAR